MLCIFKVNKYISFFIKKSAKIPNHVIYAFYVYFRGGQSHLTQEQLSVDLNLFRDQPSNIFSHSNQFPTKLMTDPRTALRQNELALYPPSNQRAPCHTAAGSEGKGGRMKKWQPARCGVGSDQNGSFLDISSHGHI